MNILSLFDVGFGLVTGKKPSPSFESIFSAFGGNAENKPLGLPTTASGAPVAPNPNQQTPTASAPAVNPTQIPLSGETPGTDYLSNLLKAIQGIA